MDAPVLQDVSICNNKRGAVLRVVALYCLLVRLQYSVVVAGNGNVQSEALSARRSDRNHALKSWLAKERMFVKRYRTVTTEVMGNTLPDSSFGPPRHLTSRPKLSASYESLLEQRTMKAEHNSRCICKNKCFSIMQCRFPRQSHIYSIRRAESGQQLRRQELQANSNNNLQASQQQQQFTSSHPHSRALAGRESFLLLKQKWLWQHRHSPLADPFLKLKSENYSSKTWIWF
jgi:hypothetical protein